MLRGIQLAVLVIGGLLLAGVLIWEALAPVAPS